MFLRAWRDSTERVLRYRHFARADLPLRIAPDFAETAFAEPLERTLAARAFGTVRDHEVFFDASGEPEALRLDLALISDRPQVVSCVTDFLEGLDAPVGSALSDQGGTDLAQFGSAEGLGLYLPAQDATEEIRLDIAEACTDALGGAGLYQGSAHFMDKTALYFYGDSFNKMRAALTFVIGHDPKCDGAVVRRLT
ncbi:MAG: hypothetical protein AAGK37_00625 [Pseudomonadota bacterium]